MHFQLLIPLLVRPKISIFSNVLCITTCPDVCYNLAPCLLQLAPLPSQVVTGGHYHNLFVDKYSFSVDISTQIALQGKIHTHCY